MGKAPASQFYWGDLKRDVEYHLMSFESRGIWIEMLTCMWDAKERGKLEGTIDQLGSLLGCKTDKLQNAVNEINVTKTGDVTNCNGIVTIINRRMFRDEKQKESIRYRVKRFREKELKRPCNTDVTPQSSSSSSLYSKKSIPDEDFLKELKEKYTWIDFDKEMVKIDAWLMVNPTRKKTRRFIVSWLSRIDKPIEVNKPDPYEKFEYVKSKEPNP